MRIRFAARSGGTGLTVHDDIQGLTLRLETPEGVEPATVDPDEFYYPVDAACRITASRLTFDRLDDVYVRDGRGTDQATVGSHQTLDLPYGTYSIEVSGQLKLYCRTTAALRVRSGADYLVLEAPEPVAFTIGARSHHETPAGTITTTEEPRDLMAAVSALSSSLKTLSCERSYPTLRGYPPLLECGDALDIPAPLDPPDSGVRVVVPPQLRQIFTVAPLAYYLGATVVPGDRPRLTTAHGFEYPLSGARTLEDAVAKTLKQCFFLDCLVRTEGFYQVDLYERHVLEQYLPFDPSDVYGLPLERQLETYLSVDHEVLETYLPKWVLTAHVPPTSEHVPVLPHVLSSLGIIRYPQGRKLKHPHDRPADYVRRSVYPDGGLVNETGEPTDFHRSSGDPTPPVLVEPSVSNESIEHAWFGNHVPRGASKGTIEAFEARLDRTRRDEVIAIDVVCNDDRMASEREHIERIYGAREDVPYDVTTHADLTCEELRSVLETSDGDFLHFIGHTTADGLCCTDGDLDATTVESVSHDVFLLNACRSYHQAQELAKRGAIGGVGTLSNIVNDSAVETGRLLANTLNLGFPLRAAVSVVREQTDTGDQYVIVGDGNADIAPTETGAPSIVGVEEVSETVFEVYFSIFSNRIYGLGSIHNPKLSAFDARYLVPTRTNTVRVEKDELREFLYLFNTLYRYESELRWTKAFEYPEF